MASYWRKAEPASRLNEDANVRLTIVEKPMQLNSAYHQLSIRTKLLISVVGLVVICVALLFYFSYSAMTRLSQEQLQETQKQLQQSVLQSMALTGDNAAAQIQDLMNVAFQVPKTLDRMMEESAYPKAPMSRERVQELTKSALLSHPLLSSAYVQFEANAYDNSDAKYQGAGGHSTNTGSLEVYWVKRGTTYTHYGVEDSNEKYDATPNEYGVRASEYYLCLYDTHKPCILDPYLYEIEPGYSELMTSLVEPIMQGERFLGMAGADINLPIVQKWLSAKASNFYQGNSKMSLISQRNLLVASTEFPEQLGRSVEQASSALTDIVNNSSSEIVGSDYWHVKIPFDIADTGVKWTLVVSIPTALALAPLKEMQKVANETFVAESQKFVLLAIILVVVAVVLVVWLASTLSRPIERVSDSIAQLASNEGDLTQQVEVSSHKELIAVADGLNRFMEKLRDMITHLKQVASEVNLNMQAMDDKANAIRSETEEQDQNLDNVVTAMNQMATSAIEVAKLAGSTAVSADESGRLLQQTQSSFRQNVDEVNALATSMQSTANQVANVASRSQEITSIISTIQAIAEQTNLLALNAAIEAARAGEQGRGFAVVADEVRSLAGRTQVSTQEISSLIQNLQSDVNLAVTALGEIQEAVGTTVDNTMASFERLSKASEGMSLINQNTAQVATAAEEQSQVSEEINGRIVAIGDGSTQLAAMSDELKGLSDQIRQLVSSMNSQLDRLRSE